MSNEYRKTKVPDCKAGPTTVRQRVRAHASEWWLKWRWTVSVVGICGFIAVITVWAIIDAGVSSQECEHDWVAQREACAETCARIGAGHFRADVNYMCGMDGRPRYQWDQAECTCRTPTGDSVRVYPVSWYGWAPVAGK